MISYIIRRILLMIPTLFVISVITFIIIQLPPGDYLTTMIANLQETGEEADAAQVEALRKRYGLDKPMYEQYFIWMGGILTRGDLGQSFSMNKPVTELIGERVALTVAVTFCAIIFTWIVAIPIGIYSATHQYKASD